MPVIPTGNEGQRLEQRSPVEGYDVQRAGIGDRMVAQFGEGVQNLGEGIVEYNKRKQDISRKINVANFREAAEQKALELHDEAIRTSKGDGSDITQIFSQKYDDWYKGALDEIKDGDAKMMARSEAMNVRNITNKDLFEKGRAKFVIWGDENGDRLLNNVTAGVRSDPDNPGVWSQRGYQALKMLEPMMDKTAIQKKLIAYEKNFAQERIMGYVDRGDYDKARQTFLSDHQGSFSPEDKQKILDKIDTEQMQRLDLNWKMNQRADAIAAKQLKENQDNNFKNIFTKQLSGAAVEAEAGDLYGKGLLRKEQWELINTQETKIDNESSKGTYYNIVNRATSGKEEPGKLMNELALIRRQGHINNDDAISATKFLISLQEKNKEDKFKDPAFKAMEKRHLELIDRQFGVKPGLLAEFSKPEDLQRAAEAKRRYVELVYFNNMADRAGQEKALRTVFKEKGGTASVIADVPAVPGLDPGQYNDTKATEEAKRNLKLKFLRKELTPAQYEDALRRMKSLKNYQDEKAKWDSWGSVVEP